MAGQLSLYDFGLEKQQEWQYDEDNGSVMCRECGALVHFIGIQPVKRHETFERFINEITERWNKTAERG